MKKILICFFLLFHIYCEGQITFERYDDVINWTFQCCPNSNSIIQAPDHGYFSCGSIEEGLVTCYYWEKVDSSGHNLWSNSFSLSLGDATSASASLTSDNGFIICGNSLVSSTMGIIKISSNGNLEWYKTLGIAGLTLVGNSAIQSINGDYLIAGMKYGMFGNDGKLIMLDGTGNVVWSKSFYGGSQLIEFTDIVQADDSGFIVLGKAISTTTYDHIILMRTDSQGDTIWIKEYVDSLRALVPTSITRSYDSSYVVSGYEIYSSHPGSFLLKINSLGDTLWKKEYGNGDSLIINNVKQLNDSSLILSATQNNNNGLLVKTNSSGDILWSKKLMPGCKSKYVIPTNDGGFAIAGGTGFNMLKTDSLGNTQCTSNSHTVTTSSSGIKQVFSSINIIADTLVFQSNGFFNLVEIQDNMLCNSLEVSNHINNQSLIQIAPNPAENYLSISSQSELTLFEIYNPLGILIQKSFVHNLNTFEIDISDLSPSTYFIKLYSKEEASTLKFMKTEVQN